MISLFPPMYPTVLALPRNVVFQPIAVSTDDIFAVIQEELDEELGIEGEEVVEEFIVIHGIANWMAL